MKKEYIYAGISIFFWSTIATVTKLLLGSLESMHILFASTFVAFLFLLIVNLIKGNLKQLKSYTTKDYINIFITGAIGIFFYHLFLYMGIDSMDASQAFIINYLWPIMIVLFACVILKEKMTLRKGIAILLSFIGVVVVTANGNLFNIEKESLKGAVLCVVAAISYGLFSVLTKKHTYDKYLSMMLYQLSALVISLIYMFITKDFFVLSVPQCMGMVWMGVFTTAIAFTLWALALEMGDTAKIANLAYVTPFLSLVWTSLILKENLSIYSLIGLVVIVLGIFIQLKKPKNN